ncbi:MAG: hypothetical protein IKK26_01175 [Clostridia bacterium]|nr:hypothetical protein [Clostridia bacterium]
MDKKILKMAAEVMRELSLNEISIKDGETEIVMKRDSAPVPAQKTIPQEVEELDFDAGELLMKEDFENNPKSEITAPLLGIFHGSPSQSDLPYVQIGSKVNKGDTLCTIESMKMMTEIPAPCNGTIVDVCVADGNLVEYGQTLFVITADN